MEMTSCCWALFEILSSFDVAAMVGERIEVEIAEMSEYSDATSVAAHLRRYDQFLGFAGSEGESQVT